MPSATLYGARIRAYPNRKEFRLRCQFYTHRPVSIVMAHENAERCILARNRTVLTRWWSGV